MELRTRFSLVLIGAKLGRGSDGRDSEDSAYTCVRFKASSTTEPGVSGATTRQELKLQQQQPVNSRDNMLLQSLWTLIVRNSSVLQSPVFPVFFSLGVYLTLCLPFLLLDLLAPRWALVRKYKLQPHSSISWASVRTCLVQTFYNHVVFIFPLTVLNWYLRPIDLPTEAPSLPCVVLQVLACLLLFDFQSFTWHLLHHRVPWLYRNFHKVS